MKKLFITMLALILVLQCGTTVLAASSSSDVALDTSAEEYYYEQESASGANALSIIEKVEIANRFKGIAASSALEVVSATIKTVYVKETLDENNNVIESRLMDENEVAVYKEKTAQPPSRGNTFVGDDSESEGKLDIYLVVYKDASRNYYSYGTADWENGVYATGQNAPAVGKDFIGITWGGGGELKQTSYSASGIYQYNQGNISFSKAASDTYAGYCWQFEETKMSGLTRYYADYIDTYVKLAKTYAQYKAKETNVKMTYIHTYQATVGTITLEAGYSGSGVSAAGGISLSSCDKQWQIQVDVPSIMY